MNLMQCNLSQQVLVADSISTVKGEPVVADHWCRDIILKRAPDIIQRCLEGYLNLFTISTSIFSLHENVKSCNTLPSPDWHDHTHKVSLT